jgi:hypothetical protein
MMVSKTKIAYLALNDALKFRMNNGGELIVPLDIFQFSTNLGIDVRFVIWMTPGGCRCLMIARMFVQTCAIVIWMTYLQKIQPMEME